MLQSHHCIVACVAGTLSPTPPSSSPKDECVEVNRPDLLGVRVVSGEVGSLLGVCWGQPTPRPREQGLID